MMRKNGILFGLLVLALALVFTACDTDDGPYTVGSTSGSVTITGLEDYNGKYVVAYGEGLTILYAAANMSSSGTGTAAQISGGSAQLKVWTIISETEIGNFSGSGTYEFMILILNDQTVSEGSSPDFIAGGVATVTFTSGTGTGVFEEMGI